MANLDGYTLSQLTQLNARIAKEIDKRTADAKASIIKRWRKLAREEGLSLEEIFASTSLTTAVKGPKPVSSEVTVLASPKVPLPAKYCNPNDLNLSWSGRGRKPAWFDAYLKNGGTIDALENAAARFNKKRQRRAAALASMNVHPAPNAQAPQVGGEVGDDQTAESASD